MPDARPTTDVLARAAAAAAPRFAAEPLEPRTLLSVDVGLSGDAGADAFLVARQGDAIDFYRNATPATGAPVEVVAADDLGAISIAGNGGDDTLTVDFAGVDSDLFSAGLTFDGGPPGSAAGNREAFVNLPSIDPAFEGGGTLVLDSEYDQNVVTSTNVAAVTLTFAPAAAAAVDVVVGDADVTFADDLGGNGVAVHLSVGPGGSATLDAVQHLASLDDYGTVTMAAGGGRALVANTLSVAGTLDLTDDDLIVAAPSAADLTALQQAVGAGVTTPGAAGTIDSTVAAARQRALGAAPAADVGLTSLDGQPVPAAALVVRYTLPGDATLDGVVNFADLGAVSSHYGSATGTAPPQWWAGDFN